MFRLAAKQRSAYSQRSQHLHPSLPSLLCTAAWPILFACITNRNYVTPSRPPFANTLSMCGSTGKAHVKRDRDQQLRDPSFQMPSWKNRLHSALCSRGLALTVTHARWKERQSIVCLCRAEMTANPEQRSECSLRPSHAAGAAYMWLQFGMTLKGTVAPNHDRRECASGLLCCWNFKGCGGHLDQIL